MMIQHLPLASVSLSVLFLAACGAAPEDPETDPVAQPLADGSAAREMKFQLEALTVWLKPELKPQKQAGATPGPASWTLRGRTAGNIEAIRSFIIGDGFGRAERSGPRSFTVTLDPHEINSLLSGLRLFVEITPASSSMSAATLALSLVPVFRTKEAQGEIALDNEVRPINVAGKLMYRGQLATAPSSAVFARASDGRRVSVSGGPQDWRVDLDFEALASEAAGRGSMKFTRAEAPKPALRAEARFIVGEAALFRGSAEALYPEAQVCLPEIQACIDSLADGNFDYGSCGAYRSVTPCQLPSDLPELNLIEHEEVDPILAAASEAQQSLPKDRRLYVNVYSVQSYADGPPRTKQVVRAWQQGMGLGGLATPSAESLVEVEALLLCWQARTLLQEATEVYGEAPIATIVDSSQPPQPARHVLLHFLKAGRLVALDLVTP